MVHNMEDEKNRIIEKKQNDVRSTSHTVEKEIIVDDVEEWPSDVVGKITEITKITEKTETQQPAPVAPVNGDARRLMERLNYFLDSVESVDARRDLNEIKKALTETLLTLQVNDEKLDSLKKRVGSLEALNLTLDEMKSSIERKISSVENKLDKEERNDADAIKYALAELRDLVSSPQDISGPINSVVREVNSIKSEIAAFNRKPIEEELVNISFRLDNLKNFLDAMEMEEVSETIKGLYKEVDLLGSMLSEKVTDIKNKAEEKMSALEMQLDGIRGSLSSADRIIGLIEDAGSRLSINSERIQGVADNITLLSDSLQSKLDVISSSSQEVEEARKALVKSSNEIIDKEEETRKALLASGSAVVDTVTDEIRRMDKRTQRVGAALQRTAGQLSKKSLDAKKLEREVARMNLRFSKLDEIDILMKIIELRKALGKRKLPTWAKRKRDSIEGELKRLEDETIDVAISRELKENMTATEIRKKIAYPEKKLKARLEFLVREGLIVSQKKGNKTLYSIVK